MYQQNVKEGRFDPTICEKVAAKQFPINDPKHDDKDNSAVSSDKSEDVAVGKENNGGASETKEAVKNDEGIAVLPSSLSEVFEGICCF